MMLFHWKAANLLILKPHLMSYQSSPQAREPFFFERVNNSKLQQREVGWEVIDTCGYQEPRRRRGPILRSVLSQWRSKPNQCSNVFWKLAIWLFPCMDSINGILLRKQIMCSASTVSLAISCAMQHHFLNSTSITIPRFVDPTQLYMMLQSTTVSFNASSLPSTRMGSLQVSSTWISIARRKKGESILLHNRTHRKETCPHSGTGTSESTNMCRGPLLLKVINKLTFHLTILPQMIFFHLTHLFPRLPERIEGCLSFYHTDNG